MSKENEYYALVWIAAGTKSIYVGFEEPEDVIENVAGLRFEKIVDGKKVIIARFKTWAAYVVQKNTAEVVKQK